MITKDSLMAIFKIASVMPDVNNKDLTKEEMMEINMSIAITEKILFEPESKFSKGVIEHIKKNQNQGDKKEVI